MSSMRRGTDALEWVVVRLACLVLDDIVPTMRLVDVDLALRNAT